MITKIGPLIPVVFSFLNCPYFFFLFALALRLRHTNEVALRGFQTCQVDEQTIIFKCKSGLNVKVVDF